MSLVFILIIHVVLAMLISAKLGEKRKIGGGWSLFFCLILGPLIGLIITLLSKRVPEPSEETIDQPVL